MKSLNARLTQLSRQHGGVDEMIELHRQALEWLHRADDESESQAVSYKQAEESFHKFWQEWRKVGLPMPATIWAPMAKDMMDLCAAKLWGPGQSPATVVRR